MAELQENQESTPTREQQRAAEDEASSQTNGKAIKEFLHNLRKSPARVRDSIVRHGKPTSARSQSQAIFSNFFLHILSVRIHKHSLRFSSTLGLGTIALVQFLLLVVTGILLMIYYKPSIAEAYNSMKDIESVVPAGRVMRNVHRWAAHGMVACVILHMARVFYTSAYKKMREFNWVLGMLLFVLTLLLSFTGYLLPWDQLAFWAITVGSNIARSPQEVTDALGITAWFDPGGFMQEALLGAHFVGEEALIRFYTLHVIVLPIALSVILAVHFWRIRKDGGLARPSEPIPAIPNGNGETKTWGLMALMRGRTPAVGRELANTVPAWPNALYAIGALTMLTTAVMLLLGYFFDAPLREIANPALPENPAKAPWYFLGLQELVGYSAFMGGVGIPVLVVIGLALIPYLDREEEQIGRWFSGPQGRRIALTSFIFTVVVTVGLLYFTLTAGWLRDWFPDIPQLAITVINPGTLLVVLFAAWSIRTVRVSNSTRMGAIALFTCFFVSFVILTYFATVHRGPNWDFYWLPSQWPAH